MKNTALKLKDKHISKWQSEAVAFLAQYCFQALHSKSNLSVTSQNPNELQYIKK